MSGGDRQKKAARGILGLIVGLFLLIVAMGGFFWWKFTPLYQLDEKERKIRLLGGFIQLDAGKGELKIGQSVMKGDIQIQTSSGTVTSPDREREFEGIVTFKNPAKAVIEVPFRAGDLVLKSSSDRKLHWKCKVAGAFGAARAGSSLAPEVRQKGDDVTLDLAKIPGGACALEVPQGAELSVDGMSALVTLDRPNYRVSVDVQNGKIDFRPAPRFEYRFKTQVMAGMVDPYFERGSAQEGAGPVVRVDLKLMNGMIGLAR